MCKNLLVCRCAKKCTIKNCKTCIDLKTCTHCESTFIFDKRWPN